MSCKTVYCVAGHRLRGSSDVRDRRCLDNELSNIAQVEFPKGKHSSKLACGKHHKILRVCFLDASRDVSFLSLNTLFIFLMWKDRLNANRIEQSKQSDDVVMGSASVRKRKKSFLQFRLTFFISLLGGRVGCWKSALCWWWWKIRTRSLSGLWNLSTSWRTIL